MKRMFLAFVLLFSSSIAYTDDITEYGEVVSVEAVGNGSDAAGSWLGRVTHRVNDVDTVYLYQSGACTRPYGNIDIFQNYRRIIGIMERNIFRTTPPLNGWNINSTWIVLDLNRSVHEGKNSFPTSHNRLKSVEATAQVPDGVKETINV